VLLNKDKPACAAGGAQTADRALQILKYIAAEKGPVPIGLICQEFELNRTTAWRLLSTLVNNGFIDRDVSTKCYQLGLSSVLLCADAAAQNEPIIRHSRQAMEELAEITQESVLLAVPKYNCTVTIAQVQSPLSIRLRDYINTTSPLYGTSNGKMALSFLSEAELEKFLALPRPPFTPQTITDREQLIEEINKTRERGFGMILSELSESENGVSAPIIYDKRPVAFISVAGPSFRFTEKRMFEVAPALISACRRVEESFRVGMD